MPWAAGLDIGGTNLKAGLVSADGKVEEFLHEPVAIGISGEAFAAQLAAVIARFAAKRPLAGVGVGVPATLRGPDHVAPPRSSNVPGLNEFPLGPRLRALTRLPVRVANDADMAMAGEARFGAARGVRNAIAFTLGTGIGTGLVLDGKLWEGAHRTGAEFGLALVPDVAAADPARPWVPLEVAVSASAVRRWSGLDPEELFRRAREGEAASGRAVATICDYLGVIITNAHYLVDLELALLCGGMAKAGSALVDGVRAAVDKHCVDYCRPGLEVGLGALGDEAAVLGAAALALNGAGVRP